jgi:hypothetical protein
MKYYVEILGIILFTIIQSCGFESQTENKTITGIPEPELFHKYSNDSIRALVFKIAYNNKSTAPSYIVFKAKDLNTNLTKEICCEAPFLSGAVHRELNINYDTKGIELVDSIILANRQRIYEFKNIEALRNISFHEYPIYDRIVQIANGLDLEDYYNKYGKNDSAKMMYFETDTGFVLLSFAHIMFNCGILTRRDCEAGNNIWFGK